MKKSIIVRNLGDLTAERDKNLYLYFIKDIPAYKLAEDLDTHQYILLGRTGSGKSAIIRQIMHMCDDNTGYTYSFINHDKNDLDYIVQQCKSELTSIPENIESIIYKLSWHYTIVINMLKNKYKDSPLRSFTICTDTDKMVYDFLKEVESSSSFVDMTIPDLFLRFMKLVKFKVTMGNSDNKVEIELKKSIPRQEFEKTYSTILKKTETFIRNDLRKVIGGDKLFILIDDLDIGWNPDSQVQQRLLSSLFSAINIYLNESNIKPIISLRTDIFKGLQVHQREKYQDLILKVDWTKELLKEFIVKRILTVYDDINIQNVEEDFFRGNVNETSLIDYMIIYTLNRPRDLLDLCKLAIKGASEEKSEFITLNHIENALNDYSVNRVIALEDEWKLLYNDLEKLIKLIAQYSVLEQIDKGYTPSNFLKVLQEIHKYLTIVEKENKIASEPLWFLEKYNPNIDDKPLEIINIFYDLGIIYLENDGKVFLQISDSSMPKITNATIIKIHPMFSRFMQVMIQEEENPWLE
jgi:ABC-type dipeptide/oligopeptide/nickel transport system ATPase component